MAERELTALRCSVRGCHNPMPYWNIGFCRATVEWVCRDHIPPEITFPVSLHGDDWLATGRSKPKDPRDK